MSPEQATGKNIAAPCDIYSLGVIAYEMLTGRPPFDGRTLAEVVSMHLASEAAPLSERTKAPRELCQLVHRMLDKDPSLRPGAIEIRQFARSLALELSTAYESFEITTGTAEPRLPKAVKPRRALALTAQPTEEAMVIDPDALEFGVTEMVPTIRKPRWTPELGLAPPATLTGDGTRIARHGELDEASAAFASRKRR
jgi:serine/threonine protein kinase